MNITTKLDHISDDFITQYLTALGVDDIKHYLKPIQKNYESPWNYTCMKKAVQILHEYINNNINIGIVIDSDTDGACSAALIYDFLIKQNVNSDKIILYHHEGKQHGIKDILPQILEKNGKNSLLIIPDAGTNDVKECSALAEATIEPLILDHHNIDEPNMFATVINNQYPKVNNHNLSGTGVTDKFVRAYCEEYHLLYPDYSDLVAISLVGDVCDLSHIENRTYVYYGLKNINNPFLAYLFEKCCKKRGKTPDAIGWDIAPLCNALARSDEQESKMLFFEGLIGEIQPEEALKQIRRVKRLQDETVKSVVTEIESNLDLSTKVIVGFTQPENASFTGLIANKFTGKYNKPTILLRDTGYGAWSGSLRSPVPLATQINQGGIANAQGHEEACGIIVKKKKLKEFLNWLETLDLSNRSNIPVVACVEPEDITIDLCNQITKHQDLWGHGVDNPKFYIDTICTQENIFVFEKSTTTLKVQLGDLACLKFFASPNDVERFRKHNKFRIELVVGELSVNEWEGVKTPQCMIKEYEITPINTVESWEDSF